MKKQEQLEQIKKILKSISENTNIQKNDLRLSSTVNTNTTPLQGKDYPGRKPLITYRALAWGSTIVSAIIAFRKNQILKKEPVLVPKDLNEPPFRFSLLEYSPENIFALPSLDWEDSEYLAKLLYQKRKKFRKIADIEKSLTKEEAAILNYLQDKHVNFYFRRIKETKQILNFLHKPDKFFSEENSWQYMLSLLLEDILTIDRGVLYKVRDESGNVISLVVLDGATIRPVIDETIGKVIAYLQFVDGYAEERYIDKNDIILFRQNLTPDVYMYGYSIPPIEILYNAILSDIFIDKGNLDYYRKGGSIPEGFLAVEPPGVMEGDIYPQLSGEQLNAIQRQIQAIMMGDYTQVPILSGGKFTWVDLKGKRRDMQFKELAEYVARKICAVYQVSPQDVGILEGSNKATAEVMASLTKAKGLEPLLALISRGFESVIDEFRKEGDLKLWFREDDLEKERDWWSTVQGKLNTGFLTINEARMEKGLEPVPWGDVPFAGLRNWEPPQEGQAGATPGTIPGGLGGLPGSLPGMPANLPSGLASTQQEGEGKGEGSSDIELLKQILASKSLETNYERTLELLDEYKPNKEILKGILDGLGVLDFGEFLEEDLEKIKETNKEVEDLVDFVYNKYIKKADLAIEKSLVKVTLLTNSEIGYKDALKILSLFYNLYSPPRFARGENYIEVFFSNGFEYLKPQAEHEFDKLIKNLNIFSFVFTWDERYFEKLAASFAIPELSDVSYGENERLYEKIKELGGDIEERILFTPENYLEEDFFSLLPKYNEAYEVAEKIKTNNRKNLLFLLKNFFVNKRYVLELNNYLAKGNQLSELLLVLHPYEANGNKNILYSKFPQSVEDTFIMFDYLLKNLSDLHELQIKLFIDALIMDHGEGEAIFVKIQPKVMYQEFMELVLANVENPIEKSIVSRMLSFDKISKDEYRLINYEYLKSWLH